MNFIDERLRSDFITKNMKYAFFAALIAGIVTHATIMIFRLVSL